MGYLDSEVRLDRNSKFNYQVDFFNRFFISGGYLGLDDYQKLDDYERSAAALANVEYQKQLITMRIEAERSHDPRLYLSAEADEQSSDDYAQLDLDLAMRDYLTQKKQIQDHEFKHQEYLQRVKEVGNGRGLKKH